VKKGEYGPVPVVSGKFKGQVGYYDDDEADSRAAVVYFKKPFDDDYEMLDRKSLVKTTITPIELERWRRKYPEIAWLIGLK